ncbi:MAG: DUF4240 domain-containing protein [Sandaracinaceae bacterium]
MNEERFWGMIETAWHAAAPQAAATRAKLLEDRDDRDDLSWEVSESAELMLGALRSKLAQLPQEELLAFDRILERSLHEIDREEIHEVTEGSDDGFLYCRGFIVAVGRTYYAAVRKDARWAVVDAECGSMPYVSFHVFAERFGEDAWVPSDISRESFSNPDGWR